jgi:hypothetical protein
MSSTSPTTITQPNLPPADLDQLLDETEGLCDNMAGPWNQLLFTRPDRPLVSSAWAEIKGTLAGVRALVRDAAETVLQQAGLRGQQLALKLKMVGDAWTNFSDLGTVGRLKFLLGCVGRVLESVAKAVPGGEALFEFVGVVERLIEKAEA